MVVKSAKFFLVTLSHFGTLDFLSCGGGEGWIG